MVEHDSVTGGVYCSLQLRDPFHFTIPPFFPHSFHFFLCTIIPSWGATR